jgi:hypothetical protein
VRTRIAGWQGDVTSNGHSVPLRLAGALHRLALASIALTDHYPPARANPDLDAILDALPAVLRNYETQILEWLESPPQTNEVRRAAIIALGLAHVSARTRLPLALYELGASAGLNLFPDKMAIRLDDKRLGDAQSTLVLEPEWRGPPPPDEQLETHSRQGCDIAPVDLADGDSLQRLRSYVWADQSDRMRRLETAIEIAQGNGVRVEAADAIEWTRRHVAAPLPGVCRVVFHTIALQYMQQHAREAFGLLIEEIGLRATLNAPLAHLAFEADGTSPGAPIFLRIWPGGETMSLGRADFHGRWIAHLG